MKFYMENSLNELKKNFTRESANMISTKDMLDILEFYRNNNNQLREQVKNLLFSLLINDLILFLYTTVLSNYVHTIGHDKEQTKRALVEDFQTRINWFYGNYMILNTGKCYYMCMGKDV